MKNNNFVKFTKSFFIHFSVFTCFLLFPACMREKLFDIDTNDFPPKLSVTAFLDGEKGVFDISVMEGHSLAYFGQVFSITREIICNGEIRLYENGELIHSVSGPFDLSIDEYRTQKNGYRHIFSGIDARAGAEYRLEADVEGYPMAVSSSIMPPALVVSASMDTSLRVNMKKIKEVSTVGYELRHFGNNNKLPEMFWPVFARVADPDPNATNYYVFDLLYRQENSKNEAGNYNWGIGVPDLTILRDVDMDTEFALFSTGANYDLYLFSMLLLGDITFALENVSRTFYAETVQINNNQIIDDSFLELHPEIEKITTSHTLYLQAKHITPAIYRYYRSLRQQENTNVLFGQPINIVSNIEGGYGSFSVYNTTSVPLMEWETCEYRKKEE